MKKIILLPTLFFLAFFGTTSRLYAQNDLDVTNFMTNTGCSFSIDVYWFDGSVCQATPSTVPVAAGASFTVTNPYGAGYPVAVTVTPNGCGSATTIGDCSPDACGNCNPTQYWYLCGSCQTSPPPPGVHVDYVLPSGGANAQVNMIP